MSEEERKFLEIVDLKKGFGSGETRQEVLRGMNFSVAKGEFCVLLGPSGSEVHTAQYHRRHRQRRFRIYQHKWRQAEGYEREKAHTVPQKAPGICVSDVQSDCKPECKGKYRGGRLSV